MNQIDSNPNRKAGESVTLSINEKVSLSMIWCPAGEFTMGSPKDDIAVDTDDEKIQRRVKLTKSFWIGTTPITCEQWLVFMKEPNFYKPRNGTPAASMTWLDARKFCEKLTVNFQGQGILTEGQHIDLPTEAQWEYACRAGTTTTWYFGNDVKQLKEHAWYLENSKDVCVVGQKSPNQWGLYDLYGNVDEWCLDNYYSYVQQPNALIDPVIMYDNSYNALKMIRGGSYNSLSTQCRSAGRFSTNIINDMGDPIGLRVVCVDTDVPQLPD